VDDTVTTHSYYRIQNTASSRCVDRVLEMTSVTGRRKAQETQEKDTQRADSPLRRQSAIDDERDRALDRDREKERERERQKGQERERAPGGGERERERGGDAGGYRRDDKGRKDGGRDGQRHERGGEKDRQQAVSPRKAQETQEKDTQRAVSPLRRQSARDDERDRALDREREKEREWERQKGLEKVFATLLIPLDPTKDARYLRKSKLKALGTFNAQEMGTKISPDLKLKGNGGGLKLSA
jgi:hypothetical protein